MIFCLKEKKKELPRTIVDEVKELYNIALSKELLSPIVDLFKKLLSFAEKDNISPLSFGLSKEDLTILAEKHGEIDEHHVTIGGRVLRALKIVDEANERIKTYVENKDKIAPSGIELWDQILENKERIKKRR